MKRCERGGSSSLENLNAGTGYPCGHAPPPAHDLTLGMIGFDKFPRVTEEKNEKM